MCGESKQTNCFGMVVKRQPGGPKVADVCVLKTHYSAGKNRVFTESLNCP